MASFQGLTAFEDVTSTSEKRYLIPHLDDISKSNWYWGRMASAEAERLLNKEKPGTFLLRESDEGTFTNFIVSFKSFHPQITAPLHIKIELNGRNRFCFKSGSPRPYGAETIAKLIKYYCHCRGDEHISKTKQLFMYPLNRNFTFSLLHLSRVAVISTGMAYEDVKSLEVPTHLQTYLQEYKYDIDHHEWKKNFREVHNNYCYC